MTAPVHVVDWMPTLCALVGYEPASDLKWDGRDIANLLTGEADGAEPRTLYWQGVRRDSAALRSGDWKLIVHRKAGVANRRELFDLAADPLESRDVSAQHPQRVEAMLRELAAHEARDNDALPGGEPAAPRDAQTTP